MKRLNSWFRKGCDVKPGIIDSDGVLRIPVDWNALTFAEVVELEFLGDAGRRKEKSAIQRAFRASSHHGLLNYGRECWLRYTGVPVVLSPTRTLHRLWGNFRFGGNPPRTRKVGFPPAVILFGSSEHR